MWQKVAYYAPFLNHGNIEKAVSFIEAKERDIKHSTITENDVRHSSRTELEFPPRLSPDLSEEEREEQVSRYDTRMLLGALEDVVNRLRLSSVSLAAIHEFIDNHQVLSRMVITDDYRLFLPDYNNMEIEMTACPRLSSSSSCATPKASCSRNCRTTTRNSSTSTASCAPTWMRPSAPLPSPNLSTLFPTPPTRI